MNDLEKILTETANELGCPPDNEGIAERAHELVLKEKALLDVAAMLHCEDTHEEVVKEVYALKTGRNAREKAHTELGEILAPMVEAGQLPKDMRQAVQTLVDFQKLAFDWFTQKGVYPVEMPNGQVLWGWDGMEAFQADPCASPFDAAVQRAEYGRAPHG